jgi:orotate phosphoribosyltransferase-like protein
MKTKEKIIELSLKGIPVDEIADELNVSIQNVYKHLRADKIEKQERKDRLEKNINLTDLDIERLSERIYLKILAYIN